MQIGQKTLVIITGCSKGLGKELLSSFCDYDTYCINRNLHNPGDHVLDLSKHNIDNDLQIIREKSSNYSSIVFINNASTISPILELRETNGKELEMSIFTNYINPAKIILTLIQLQKKTVIVNLTSGAAFTNNSKLALYSSSKAAMHRYIDILAQEEKDNEDVLLISNFNPGRMNTDMQHELILKKEIHIKEEDLSLANTVANEVFKLINGALKI